MKKKKAGKHSKNVHWNSTTSSVFFALFLHWCYQYFMLSLSQAIVQHSEHSPTQALLHTMWLVHASLAHYDSEDAALRNRQCQQHMTLQSVEAGTSWTTHCQVHQWNRSPDLTCHSSISQNTRTGKLDRSKKCIARSVATTCTST